MKKHIIPLTLCLLGAPAQCAVNVFVQDSNGGAVIRYACTAGEVVRSFALNVQVDKGYISGITNFFRGVSTSAAQGYGIFPAAFRDHITVSSGTNANWNVSGYSPVAAVADSPGDTLPGLGTSGVTLEFGGLWDSSTATSSPAATGTLCWLQISEAAQVSVTTNASRGGVVSATSGAIITPVFVGGYVDPSVVISGIQVVDGVVIISFKGGELESAPDVGGPWTGTGNTSGIYTNTMDADPDHYFRVHRH